MRSPLTEAPAIEIESVSKTGEEILPSTPDMIRSPTFTN
ncbi:hypothetical protein GRAN_3133 [Granulicella sibirica]|uniref:Uncharacterized protein n=1 Tax=Granulicella sibirica TaxID=2479048 RepID=A0A4Q0T406_9BACT|nr:hypothetical protein GRAN_3133 [Granulicella sibirica]